MSGRYAMCNDCKGVGSIPSEGGSIPCVSCAGVGQRIADPHGAMQDILIKQGLQDIEIAAIKATQITQGTEIDKIQNIKAKVKDIQDMLESTVYGLQKMSSNLDDIMVKLDV